MKTKIVLLCVVVMVAILGCGKQQISIEPFRGVSIHEACCYYPENGSIVWTLPATEIENKIIPQGAKIIGFGHFNESRCPAIMCLKYNNTKKMLCSERAQNPQEPCECLINLKGAIKQKIDNYKIGVI